MNDIHVFTGAFREGEIGELLDGIGCWTPETLRQVRVRVNQRQSAWKPPTRVLDRSYPRLVSSQADAIRSLPWSEDLAKALAEAAQRRTKSRSST
jgi:hypothetical protein